MKSRMEAVGGEVMALHKLAEAKLLDNDPDLPTLQRNLDKAVEMASKAIGALEGQSSLNRQKTEAARELVASSQKILRMLDDMGADTPYVPAAKAKALSKSLTGEPDAAPAPPVTATKAPPRLR